MARWTPFLFAALATSSIALVRSHEAVAVPADPAARGLDVFAHVPATAAPGSTLPLQVEAFGFATVVAASPLAGAEVEAVWNPEKLGDGAAQAPPGVKATTDANGRAHLDVKMPDGESDDLELLVGVRIGSHARTRTIAVHRTRSTETRIHVSDAQVVPGSSISAWVMVTSIGTGEPLANAPVQVVLSEGGVPRFEAHVTTDAAGNAMTRVPIPRTEDPAWTWELSANAFEGAKASSAHVTLTPREETPGAPHLTATWAKASVLAGERAAFSLEVRDATDQPIADLPVRYWIGPRGTKPPKDDKEWLKLSTRAMTNAQGEVSGAADTPSTVVQRVGSSVTIIARTNVEGHDLSSEAAVSVGIGTASAELFPEARVLVPGVSERMLLRVHDGRNKPIAASFVVEGDGLKDEVKTNAFGEAEVTWKVPADVGANRNVGPCAGGVAASVRVRASGDVPQLAPRRDPFELCVPVDREASGIVLLDRTAARMGDKVHVSIVPAAPSGEVRGKAKRAKKTGPWSVVVRSNNEAIAASAWIDDGEKGGEIELPKGELGIYSVSAVSPDPENPARVLGSSILVAPRVLPKLGATVAGGRAAPGGSVDVDATLVDENGKPLRGSIAALMIDARGGGSIAGLTELDTRSLLCSPFSVDRDRCDKLVEGDASFDAVRRGDLAARQVAPLAPVIDPGAEVKEALKKSFADVVHSLEGAVMQATKSADQLRDVRRRVGQKWEWNPELMTLVTAAMSAPPETPGGEPLALLDLMTIDPQVTFDNVARRIARRKLFDVLVAVRQFRHEHQLDPDEPSLQNPNAILRRLVREQKLTDDMLVDPWGGTIQFAKTAGPSIPFLSVVRGFELRAPGPDGTLGNGDDVRDPFERVLKSGTPYAKAVQEDRGVDAKFEMEVGDATVQQWQSMFAELWGSEIGDSFGAGGLGLTGIGEGGGGRGEGIGLGSIGTIGHGRGTSGVETGVAFWAPPTRTDEQGHLRIHVPLRDIETTWRLALVAVPDGGMPATISVDIPVALPISARVDAGARWIEGDALAASITVRNRTSRPVQATVTMAASGVAELADNGNAMVPLSRAISIPAEGASVVPVRLRANKAGDARLDVRVQTPGLAEDIVSHTWEVAPAGELADFTSAEWVESSAELSLTMPPQAIRIIGAPRVVIERGYDQAIAGALEALDPETLSTPSAMADAIEVASRVRRWAIARGGEADPLAVRALTIGTHATGRLATYLRLDPGRAKLAAARASAFAPASVADLLGKPPECPDGTASIGIRLESMEAEPPPVGGASKACWDAYVTSTVDVVERLGDEVELARLLLALAERPHRAIVAASVADRLRERVSMKASGAIALPDALASQRTARATVFAALLRSIRLGKSRASVEKLASWVLVQRDVRGGYGASSGTRSAVRALLSEGPALDKTSKVTIASGSMKRELDVGPSARVVVPLEPNATSVSVEVNGPGVLARFERPVLRLWSRPPDESASPLHVETAWPADARAGKTGVLRVTLRHALDRPLTADVRVPLPPGVSLAEPLQGARQVQGALMIRRALDASATPTPIEIPVRFALAGTMTVPEARATVAFEEFARAIAPARPLVVAAASARRDE